MPPSIWNIQWDNQNSQRSYPIVAWGTGADQTNTIKIPDNFLISLYFPVHAGMAVQPERFFIKSLGIYPIGYSIVLGYDDGTSSPPEVAVVNISATGHTAGRSYALSGSGDFADSVGQVAVGSLDDMQRLPPGVYHFDPAATSLEVDCIRPLVRGISSLTIVNGSDRSPKIYGDVELVAGTNFRIVATTEEGHPTQIVFNAISGEGLTEACICDDENPTGEPIRFINGIPPLPDGNYRIVGTRCVDIQPILNGLLISDSCTEPCCGCEALEAVTQQINRFADGASTLQNFASVIGGEVSQMSMVVLGSKLADTGCVES